MSKEIPKDLLITLERTMCMGTCPAYKITIDHNGKTKFEGYYFTKTKGTAQGSISSDRISELLSDFEAANFFELRDRYVNEEDGCTQLLTCQPSEILSIELNGKSKSIYHDVSCNAVKISKNLSRLCKKIDKFTNSKKWVGDEIYP